MANKAISPGAVMDILSKKAGLPTISQIVECGSV